MEIIRSFARKYTGISNIPQRTTLTAPVIPDVGIGVLPLSDTYIEMITFDGGIFWQIFGYQCRVPRDRWVTISGYSHVILIGRKIIGLMYYDYSGFLDVTKDIVINKRYNTDYSIWRDIIDLLDIFLLQNHYKGGHPYYLRYTRPDEWHLDKKRQIVIRKSKKLTPESKALLESFPQTNALIILAI